MRLSWRVWGLYLHVKASGKFWRYNYRINDRSKTLSFGAYPEVSLKLARELLARGVDPLAYRQSIRKEQGNASNTLEAISREWILKHLSSKSETYRYRVVSYLERDVFPFLGKRPIAEIKPLEVAEVIERIGRRVQHDSHVRTLQSLGQIFRHAIATGRAELDPTASLKGLFSRKSEQVSFPAITDPLEVGRLMRAIENYPGNFLTQCALKLSALVMLRPGELIGAEWQEIDLEAATWTIEVRRMKADTRVKIANQHRHIIPLSNQALAIFYQLWNLTGHYRHVFPGIRKPQKPMNKETVSKALHRMGFKGEMTGHGFRSMASSLLNGMEPGCDRAAIGS